MTSEAPSQTDKLYFRLRVESRIIQELVPAEQKNRKPVPS